MLEGFPRRLDSSEHTVARSCCLPGAHGFSDVRIGWVVRVTRAERFRVLGIAICLDAMCNSVDS